MAAPWSWISLDGKSVAAIPSHNRIDVVDTQDFSLLGRIQGNLMSSEPFHEHAITRAIWNSRRVCLLSLSSTALLLHTPDREKKIPCSSFTLQWHLQLDPDSVADVAFSRCGQSLLLGGTNGLSVWNATSPTDFQLWWEDTAHPCDFVVFSPSRTVFASHEMLSTDVYVWRHAGRAGSVPRAQVLGHDEEVEYISWKPTHYQPQTSDDHDGTRSSQWDEPACVLLTLTRSKTVRIWTEQPSSDRSDGRSSDVVMTCIVFLQPSLEMDIIHAQWIVPRAQNISQEYFGPAASAAALPRERLQDWLSVVDSKGVLHVWTVDALHLPTQSQLLQTGFVFKVDGEDETLGGTSTSLVASYQIAGYASQGFLSSVSILLERTDQVLLSYQVAWTPRHPPVLKEKSWYRGHTAPIAALATHPSLPLVVSVSHPRDGVSELIIFWLSLSMFTSESHFVPSCILQGPAIAAVHWIPTRHFQARPLLLVSYASGRWEIFSPYDSQLNTLLESPRIRHQHSADASSYSFSRLRNDTMVYPWTYHEHVLGESGFEYEVSLVPHPEFGLGLTFTLVNDKIVVAGFTTGKSDKTIDDGGSGDAKDEAKDDRVQPPGLELPAAASRQISLHDECISVNNISMKGKLPIDLKAAVAAAPPHTPVMMRFRTPGSRPGVHDPSSAMAKMQHWSISSQDGESDDSNRSEQGDVDDVDDVHDVPVKPHGRGNTTSNRRPRPRRSTQVVVSGGCITKFGGWSSLGHVELPCTYADLAVAPLYSDKGGFVSDAVVLFGVTTDTRDLHCWMGVEYRKGEFEFFQLNITAPPDSLTGITAVGAERDYRQRAFETSSTLDSKTSATPVWNALLFIGDDAGCIHHWRCRVSQHCRTMDMSLVHSSTTQGLPEAASTTAMLHPSAFFRRGYAMPPSTSYADGLDAARRPKGVFHMELDDPNRLAVVYTDQPESLYIWEGESGLGMLRLEAIIASEGRGHIVGFCWCSGHVEFHVDPLAVHFATSLVIYSYDLHLQTWVPESEQSVFYPLFDCTRDASALILAAGSPFPGSTVSYHEVPTVLGKWDVHRHAVTTDQPDASANDQKHCPVWHPYTVLTTLCGMPARVGLTHTTLADYRPAYDVQLAFGEAEQMLKLLAHVLEDDASTDLSAENGVLVYLHEKKTFGRRASVGRFTTTAGAPTGLSRAEDLFAPSHGSMPSTGNTSAAAVAASPTHQESLTAREIDTLVTALDAVLRKHTQKVSVRYEEQEHRNAYVLFDSFELEHVLELKSLILFVQKMQSCLLNGYDLPAQRYFVAYLLTTCLQEVVQKTDDYVAVSNDPLAQYEDSTSSFVPTVDSYLHEIPSSSVIWALHSQSQNLLVDQCIHPQALWDDLRPLWPGMWVRDPVKLRSIVEKVAKCTFTRTKDAMNVSLLYIALKKQTILGALAKVSKVESNKTLAEFLAHDFTDERWSVAAIRNAYSLLRKKQYELAAAFFLLPTPPRLQESLRIIIGRLHDPSLAMVVARLVECDQAPPTAYGLDDGSDIFHVGEQTTEILRNDLVPLFRSQHNRWLESAALWWLHEFDQAAAVLQPSSQLVDVVDKSLLDTMQTRASAAPASLSLVLRTKMAMDFFINLTSLPLYFQFSYCEVQQPLLKFAYAKLVDIHPTLTEEEVLTTKTDIDLAYSFTAYVCKHTGLSDTALLQMLQARHLLQVHVKKNFLYMLDTHHSSSSVLSTDQGPMRSRLNSQHSQVMSPRAHFFGSPRIARNNLARRTSSTPFSLDFTANEVAPDTTECDYLLLPEHEHHGGDSDKAPTSLWPKPEIADMECRRWSSSAFVGKMIGMRVAREMISHFRLQVDPSGDNHHGFLKELLDPLAVQFKVDRQYILEATLSVLQPHAPLHLVECCFVLSELDRTHVMQEWIQCVSLSMLHATSHFPTVDWTDDVLREWKHLTVQLRHLQLLCDDNVLSFASPIRRTMQWAMQLGLVVLAWCTNHPEKLHDVITTDNSTVLDAFLVQPVDAAVHPCHPLNFGYTFLTQSTHLTSHLLRVRQLYSTILMTQIVRTVYCNDQQALLTSPDNFNDVTDNGCNGLYMPKTLWRAWTRHPLAGLKRWYLAMEAHVQLELHRIVLAEAACECGHYGIDLAVRPWQSLAVDNAVAPLDPNAVADEDVLLWMQHPLSGVPTTLRRYRVDPRVYVQCFTLKDAYVWLHDRGLCHTLHDTHVWLGRWCKSHKVRWLVRRRSAMASHGTHSNGASAMPLSTSHHGQNGKISLELIPDEAFCFVSPWEVDAELNVHVYMHGETINGNGGGHHDHHHLAEPHGIVPDASQRPAADPACETTRLDLGWDTLLPLTSHLCDDAAKVMFPNAELKELWQAVCGEGWLVTAVQHFDADGLYMRQSQHGSSSTKQRSRYLANLFKQVQRNRLFRYLGLPHRLVAVITVELVEGKDLLASDILSHTADPYVFMTLSTESPTSPPPPTPTAWSIKSYRSRHLVATLNPKWGTEHDRFPFRLALPVHEPHDGLPKTCREALLQHAYDGPPTALHCAVYNKCKLRQHPFMGSAKINLKRLTAAQPMDGWVDLDNVSTGSLHIKISLKYQLMSSSSFDLDFGMGREMACQV
ncbi:hypothetical protein H310_12291 [Aphanomyces invadans]|uniref:C2 domain-containing protein n=1 Tax=Aphanomyces invadans TaxID=157072 RepID=A0A024TK33_9STRA|nr:hypothetical protein H310_12291 [Aphanomyces invadans]ETV93956.1 hypothetical protein H310_12291 [Aphanomyces invadans]|eukprot:XP_008877517.1 hypothetical protein H310_12291 [Aphanomyces invadans]